MYVCVWVFAYFNNYCQQTSEKSTVGISVYEVYFFSCATYPDIDNKEISSPIPIAPEAVIRFNDFLVMLYEACSSSRGRGVN